MTADTGDFDEAAFARVLGDIARASMPFGKFGPKDFPPRGVPIYDLPYEYLAYFARKGFPAGRLGELMEFVFLAKQDGADAVFDPLRTLAGGRTNLRKTRRKEWRFRGGGSSG